MAQKKPTVEFFKQTPAAPKAVKKLDTDEILSGTDKFEYLVGQYWKQIVSGIVAIAVIVVVLILIQFVRANNEQELRRSFAAATTIEQLSSLIKANANHPSSIPARENLAQLYVAEKQYRLAYETMREIYECNSADTFLRLKAAMQGAYLLEQANDIPAAIQAFKDLIADPDATEIQRQEATYAAARLLIKQGNSADASALLSALLYDEKNANYWTRQCDTLKHMLAAGGKTADAKPAPAK